jgi:PP-loop superfamily ATP-utilizing enzyme
MPITLKIDPSKLLSTFIATGKICSNEIVEMVESFYKKQQNSNVLWDLRYADLEAIVVSDELENIAASFTELNLELQKVGKTAIVASVDL